MTAAEESMKLHPEEVFSHFVAISAIPRGSGHEQVVGAHLLKFAESLGLAAERDEVGNVLIRKPAGPGGENAAPVVLQAHLDMVWESDGDFDFATSGLRLLRDGDWLHADHTTLGADNGIGIAYCMAVLQARDMPHPPIEVILTVAEETGMDGAIGFDVGKLSGSRLINIDSEEEGVLYASCSGGQTATLSLPAQFVLRANLPEAEGLAAYTVEVTGLRGGHSGAEIDKDRGNSNRLLGRVLADVGTRWPFCLASAEGGRVDNAIPARSAAVALWHKRDEEALRSRLTEWQTVFRRELAGTDANVSVPIQPADLPKQVIGLAAQTTVIAALMLLPHGVVSMDRLIPGQELVETSTNFAMVRMLDDYILFTISMRSSLESKLNLVAGQLELLAKRLGMQCSLSAAYPGWAYEPDSVVRKVFQEISGAKVMGIHAGLECGVFAKHFAEKGRKADLISLGPDITGAHTPEERLSISSTGRIWEVLRKALQLLCTR